MNFNLDLSVVTRFLRGTLNELRQKRLWPVAAVLLAAMVAVPFVLGKSSPPAQQAQVPAAVPPPSSATTLPALNVQSTPAHSQLTGHARDPFGIAAGGGSTASSTSTSAPNLGVVSSVATAANNAVNALNSSTANSASSSAGTSSTASGGTSSSSASSGTGTTSSSSNPPSITGNAKPKPAPSGLTSTQAYDVALSMTNSSGGVDVTDPLERLTVLPSRSRPLLVELGVLQGGKSVLFAVEPGTAVYGPGRCTPGPIDCEILSLGQDQTESVASRADAGDSAEFAVTGVTAVGYSSKAAADKVRQAQSSAGRAVLLNSSLPALSLFQYEPSVGSIVDLRNLIVGG